MPSPSHANPLERLFSGLTEQTFYAELGVADPGLIDYVARLLSRFVHRDAIYAIKGASGRRLEELAEMMVEADKPQVSHGRRREIFRHMGDFALFWTGVYPEAIEARVAACAIDALIDYTEQGKRSYYIASTYSEEPYVEEAPILRRLSDEFELCAYGLRRVRHHWQSKTFDA
jgi:hypothetical protein